MIDFIKVGSKLAKLRKDNNLTQDDVASTLYITRQLVSKWEMGLAVPGIENLLELSKLYKTQIEDILCLNDEDLIDNDNIFNGHNRYYIIKKVINKELKVDLYDVFYQFSPEERLYVLKQIIEGKYETDLDKLKIVLSESEKRYLEKAGK